MQIEIEKKDQTWRFDAEPGESILYAGLRAGVPLPYECATGTCGTCRARVKEGEVDEGWPEAPGKKRFKPERRDILMCQACATKDCNIAVGAAIKPFRDDDLDPAWHHGTGHDWERLTHDVIRFKINLDQPVTFHAGQFFVVEVPGMEGYRAYSMVNFEPDCQQLEFVVKRKTDGGFSDWLFEQATGEQPLKLFGPLGRATFHVDEAHDLFMVAGGSGIAGLLSILEHASETDHFIDHRATVFFGVRTPADLFFADRLCAIKRRHPDNITITVVYSESGVEDTTESTTQAEELAYDTGFVHDVALPQLPEGAPNTLIYLAGPPPMVDACIRNLVIDQQVPAQQIRYDKFG